MRSREKIILEGVACAHQLDLEQQVHSMIFKMGYVGNVYSCTALLDMYAKCERVEVAYVVFRAYLSVILSHGMRL
uniref:Pentatricopeptide repeat-containing protein n=1 Tax=Quercus lobata TaxID=97700 RepID=A0A7N2LUN6_QUELO